MTDQIDPRSKADRSSTCDRRNREGEETRRSPEERPNLYELTTQDYFDSAHFLADYHGKCENLHGHRWKVEATICADELGDEGTERDMVRDFGEFKRIVRETVAEFDHTFLVEDGTLKASTIEALEGEGFTVKVLPFRTTAENLAKNFFDLFESKGLPVCRVEVDETPNNRAVYRKDR